MYFVQCYCIIIRCTYNSYATSLYIADYNSCGLLGAFVHSYMGELCSLCGMILAGFFLRDPSVCNGCMHVLAQI